MKRQVWWSLALIAGAALVSAQMPRSEDGAARLIAHVKQTPASQLDSTLPKMAFEQWLQRQAGPDATIAWVTRTSADDSKHDTPWVEADISLHGRPGIVIMIADGSTKAGTAGKPKFRSLELAQAGDQAEWKNLHDLPLALKRARDNAQ